VNDKFEDEVERTLAHLAKVDRSTTESVRAAIALLPDRRSNRLPRFGRPISVWPDRRREFAAAGAVALVVAVVGFSMLGRFQTQPVGPGSPAPSTPAAPATASASPVVGPTPTTGASQQAPQEGLAVFAGDSLTVLGWSPDGSKFAVLDQPRGSADVPSLPTVRMFDRSGMEIGSVQASDFGWLDSSSYVILRLEVPAGPSPTVGGQHAYLGRIGSTELTPLGTYDWIVAGPSGSVALIRPWNWTVNPPPTYVVVSAGGAVSAPRQGYAMAWSRDGSMLAVLHVTGPTGAHGTGSRPYGWPEVVRSTGESVASARQVASDLTGPAAFSPDGARVAFLGDSPASPKDQKVVVLETGTGKVTTLSTPCAFTWASSDQLLIAHSAGASSSASDRILAWSASTGQLTDYGPGDIVGASGEGTVVTGFDGIPGLTWTSGPAGSPSSGTIALWDTTWMGVPDVAWSPDGSRLVLIAGDENANYMDAVLFPG